MFDVGLEIEELRLDLRSSKMRSRQINSVVPPNTTKIQGGN